MFILDILVAITGAITGALLRAFLKHKDESNKWKENHSERLAKIEQLLEDRLK